MYLGCKYGRENHCTVFHIDRPFLYRHMWEGLKFNYMYP